MSLVPPKESVRVARVLGVAAPAATRVSLTALAIRRFSAMESGGDVVMRRLAFFGLLLLLPGFGPAPSSDLAPVLPTVRPWTARWISVPDASPAGYGVYHFRRRFRVDPVPAAFVVHVSADNRYELYANGARVASGPARADHFHW